MASPARTRCWLTGLVLALLLGAFLPPAAADAADLPELRDELTKALRRKQDAATSRLLDQMIELGSVDAAEVLIADALLSGRPEIETMLQEKLAAAPWSTLVHWLCNRCNNHERYEVRVQLVRILTHRDDRDAFVALLSALLDPVEPVKMAAVSAMRSRNQRTSIPHLIRALEQEIQLERELGQIATEIRELLNDWYGKELYGPSEFLQVWNRHKDILLDPNKQRQKDPLGEIDTRFRGTGVDVKVDFFGEEILTQRIVFVMDTSISMKEEDAPPPPEEESRPGVDGDRTGGTGVGGDGREGDRRRRPQLGERQRLKRVQNELVRLISNLPPKFEFTIISFDNEVTIWAGALQKATKKNKNSAIQFVRDFKCDGETWTDEAMEAAFAVPRARSIVLLSDGQPYRSKNPIHIPTFLDRIDEWNRFENRTIQTIGFRATSGRAGSFLKQVASRNHGTYTELP